MRRQIEIIEGKRSCSCGHNCFYTIIEGDKSYCMICYALGFAHHHPEIKDKIIETEYGKQIKKGEMNG